MRRLRLLLPYLAAVGAFVTFSASAAACEGCGSYRHVYAPPVAHVYAPFGYAGRAAYYEVPVYSYRPAYQPYAYVAPPICDRQVYAPAYGHVYAPGWGVGHAPYYHGHRTIRAYDRWRGW